MTRDSKSAVDVDRAVPLLNAMARHHFRWICESFVHVLILREWQEPGVSERIDDEYEREVPRCFRIVERILELGASPMPKIGSSAYAQHLPAPGRTVAEMIERERDTMTGFDDALDTSIASLANAGDDVGAAIANEAKSNRAAYLAWLAEAGATISERNRERTLAAAAEASHASWIALNRLYAQLQSAVEEGCVQMLLLRQAGQAEAADHVWRDSFAYMLYAGDVVRVFAHRDWAFDLADPEVSGDVMEPEPGHSAEGALESERTRLRDLADHASGTATLLSELNAPELEAIPRGVAQYARARLEGEKGDPPRTARSIDTVLEEHAYRTT
jgi:bacterioferritin (cytochrome b1)